MVQSNGAGSSLMLEDGLQAGFIVTDEGRTKDFCAFEVLDGPTSAQFVRPCTREEKKKLKKMFHGQKIVKSVPCSPGANLEGILLFTLR